jgi:hypothetical protein
LYQQPAQLYFKLLEKPQTLEEALGCKHHVDCGGRQQLLDVR